jgi:transcriptional regulator with XRE-family HTH domain
MTVSTTRQRELADFLRNRRERIQPTEAGLPHTPRRRTPGLRREELAQLAGISATWYTHLEQGRNIRVSGAVLESLVRALRLDENERTHLFLLAHGNPPPERACLPETLDARLTRLLDVLDPHPAYVVGARSDVLGWNRAAALLFTDFGAMPPERRNLVWWVFTDPRAREALSDWEHEARAVLARFRTAAGRHPDDPRFLELVDELSRHSPLVRQWWARHDVLANSNGTKRLCHPRTGPMTLDHTVLQVAEAPEQKLVVYSAPPGSSAAAALARLTSCD